MTKPNEPAFARKGGERYDTEPQEGLSKREYIASQALAGLLANSNDVLEPQEAAAEAVERADALIAELNKEPK